MTCRPITPKEFSAAIAGLRSERWVREQCALWRKTKGKRGIQSLTPRAPYIIPAAELARFRPALAPFAVEVCA